MDIRQLDEIAREKGIPKVGSKLACRTVLMVGEDEDGCATVTLLCSRGHRSTVRLYSIIRTYKYKTPEGCLQCMIGDGRSGKLTNAQAKRMLEQMEDKERKIR